MMDNEVWKSIPEFDGYQVSDLGRVRSFKTKGRGNKRRESPLLLRPAVSNKKSTRYGIRHYYLGVNLRRNGKSYYKRVHLLVLLAFVGPRPSGHVTRHLDGDSTNNKLSNLCYGTHGENGQDTRRHNGERKNFNPAHVFDEYLTTDMSYSDIKRKYGISVSYLSRMINGHRPIPDGSIFQGAPKLLSSAISRKKDYIRQNPNGRTPSRHATD